MLKNKGKSREQITIYRPNQRHDIGFFQTWLVMAANVSNSRELIWQLFKRDFLASYKKSFLGVAWVFISPVVGIVSWVYLNKTGMLNPGDVGIPYTAYVLIGSSIWGLFVNFFDSAQSTLVEGKDFVMQVYYPHEVLLFKKTAQYLANFTIAFVMNILVLFIYNVIPSWKIVFFPIVILPAFFFGAAIGLFFSMAFVVSIDIGKVTSVLLTVLMYFSPIIYSDQINNAVVQTIIKWNPLTHLVCSARDIILFGRLYDNFGYAICTVLSIFLFLVSWRLFYITEDKIIERMI